MSDKRLLADIEDDAYRRGFEAAMAAFAIWRDGTQYVGSRYSLNEAMNRSAEEFEKPLTERSVYYRDDDRKYFKENERTNT